mmetsp:Transcript_2893/g.6565  ORF Transcript_2893/g.6565 Transcript_2893/m.6565 type:complete len:328 (+) Transcript_2893:273-1256(+)
MLASDLGAHLSIHGVVVTCPKLICSDCITHCCLGGTLAELRQIRTTEALGLLRDEGQRDIGRDGGLLQGSFEDALPGRKIRKRNVDQLIQSTWTQERLVEKLRSVGGADEEDVLFRTHAIDLCEQLVHHAVARATGIALSGAAGHADGVQLIEEEHAGSSGSGLVEDLAHVGLGLAEPHREELRAFDADEVGGAFGGHGFGQQRLAAARRAVEEHTARRLHSKLLELLRVVDWVQDRLLQGPLRVFKTTDVVPFDVGHLHHCLSQGGGVHAAHRRLEVLLGHGHRVQDLCVDGLFLQIDEIHLLPDARERSFRTELGQVSTDEAVGV